MIKIDISIELSNDEVLFLRKHFEDDSEKQLSAFRYYINNKTPSDYNIIIDKLSNDGILNEDHVGNHKLTFIGKIIVKKINRNSIIDGLLE